MDASNFEAGAPTLEELEKLLKYREIAVTLGMEHAHGVTDAPEAFRILRECNLNIDDALVLLAKQEKARKFWKLDSLMSHPPTDLLEIYGMLFPHSFHGFDKFGRPIHIQCLGAMHLKLFSELMTPDVVPEEGEEASAPSHEPSTLDSNVVLLAHTFDMETQSRRARERGEASHKTIETFVNIVDLAGLGMNHTAFLSFFRKISELDDILYPDRLFKTFIVNAPALFPSIWGLVAKFLPPRIRERVIMLGSNHSELLQYIDADQLPVQYGGTCHCVSEGGCVKQWTEEQTAQAMKEYEQRLGIIDLPCPKGAKQVHSMHIDASEASPKSASFSFRTLESSIDFCVEFVSDVSQDVQTLRPMHKVESQSGLIHGNFLLSKPGTLNFIFDNSGTWFNKNKIVKLSAKIHDHVSGSVSSNSSVSEA